MFEKKERREPTEPQLAALIDVLAILIIFLVAGQVMGDSSIILPPGLNPPRSLSNETMVNSAQVTIGAARVNLSFSTENFPLNDFLGTTVPPRFQSVVTEFLRKQKGKEISGLINLLADRKTPYDQVYAVIKALRVSGLNSILLVSLRKPGHE